MPSNEKRKYQQVIDYVEDQIGADINRDLLEVAIGAQDVVPIEVETALKEALKSSDNDEIVVRLAGSDGSEIVEETLDTNVNTGDVALLTYLARALNTVGSDEMVSRVTDSLGNQIDPATDALEAALKSNDTDEFVARVVGADGVGFEDLGLDVSPTGTEESLVTYPSRALSSVQSDELRVDIQDAGIQIPVDNQSVLDKNTVSYGTGIETEAVISLSIDGYGTAEVYFNNATQATDIAIERSWDGGGNWETMVTKTGVTSFNDTYSGFTAGDIRAVVTGTGTAGDTADVIIGGIP